MTNDYSDMLRQTAFSEGLTGEELKVISPICHECQFKEGEQIFGQNKSDCPLHMKCMKDMSVDYVLSKI